jgi:membrane glycosyltransferase
MSTLDTTFLPEPSCDAVQPRPSADAALAPRLSRSAMPARPWLGLRTGLRQFLRPPYRVDALSPRTDAPAPWEQAAASRRRAFLLTIATLTVVATVWLAQMLPAAEGWGQQALRVAQIGLFSLLFAWVSAGFATALMGFVVHLRGDRHALSADAVRHRPLPDDARTALIMPICNEHVPTVFAGLRATCESLAAAGGQRHFDLYVLSDSSRPELWAAERAAWEQLRASLDEDGIAVQVYYRRRKLRRHRKAGNVADFCRRWGRNYRYMVVLDADSVMSGQCLTDLVRLMEAHPQAGIIQTLPQAVGQTTLHARAQQFASRVTGRLFTLGMQYWQLGESHYWGHNAIIRVAPFMAHCGLADVPGRGALSGEILSHDFVEAALMRRAGYHVWLVSDLGGSYEQNPPNLIEELQRDRRWCQGNLQNFQLIAEPGFHPVHRAMLATGAMAYVSAPLWLAFLGLGVAGWVQAAQASGTGLTPPSHLLALWTLTLALLMLPRALAVAVVCLRGEQGDFGGTFALVRSAFAEAALSVVQAPVRMAAHTGFVVAALTGWRIGWKSPSREALALHWHDALRRFAPESAGAGAALLALGAFHLHALPWVLPVGLPLLAAAPLAVWTSRESATRRIAPAAMLLIPEERQAPKVLRRAWRYARQQGAVTA